MTISIVGLLVGNNYGQGVSVEGFAAGPDTDNGSRYDEVSPGFFKTMGIPLLAGREFTRADVIGGRKVAIVNETFAEKFKLGKNAVGKLMARSVGDAVKLEVEIVGLAQDAKYSEVKAKIPPVFYVPTQQDDQLGYGTFYVRSGGDPAPVLKAIPGVIASLDGNLPVEDLRTMPQQVRENVFLDRMITTLSAAFAIRRDGARGDRPLRRAGLHVAQRTREFGLRMALGADPQRVRGMVLWQVGWMTLIGGVVGMGLAICRWKAAQPALRDQRLRPDGARAVRRLRWRRRAQRGLIPAIRASRIDPMRASLQ